MLLRLVLHVILVLHWLYSIAPMTYCHKYSSIGLPLYWFPWCTSHNYDLFCIPFSCSANLVAILHLIMPCLVPINISWVLAIMPSHAPGCFAGSPLSRRTVFIGKYTIDPPNGTNGVAHVSPCNRSWGERPSSPQDYFDNNPAAHLTHHATTGEISGNFCFIFCSNWCRNTRAFSCARRTASCTLPLLSLSPTGLLTGMIYFGLKSWMAPCHFIMENS